jgi:pimeloyl-ACP methyl ester carboxylesterase
MTFHPRSSSKARRTSSEADIVFGEPCHFEAWPKIPIRVIAGRDDRFFPIEFQRRVARERLNVAIDELPGGHLIALSNPRGLIHQLLNYQSELAWNSH